MAFISLEIAVVLGGILVLLTDLWTPAAQKKDLGYGVAVYLALILAFSFTSAYTGLGAAPADASASLLKGVVLDSWAILFKRFFLVAAIFTVLMTVDYGDTFESGRSEYHALTLFALAGMMLAASAADFVVLFVSLELMTITFYVLASFHRSRMTSLEAGVKYLILGALASAFLVYGIALLYGTLGSFDFRSVAGRMAQEADLVNQPLVKVAALLILVGLAFKIAAFPFQFWTPDVYQGAPAPTTAFLAVGSKAAGFVLLSRFLWSAVPMLAERWQGLLAGLCAVTILYGNLCAIPQRNLKRLLGYSSIAHAGYLLLGICAYTPQGLSAMVFYLAGYLVTVMAAFGVIGMVMRTLEAEDIAHLRGLHRRSPMLALALSLSMISLAGIPPTVGFLGKFMLIKAALAEGISAWVVGSAIVGVVISLYFYFGVIRTVYGSEAFPGSASVQDDAPLRLPLATRLAVFVCLVGIVGLGVLPGWAVAAADEAVRLFQR